MNCLFCDWKNRGKKVIYEFKNCFIVEDEFPVSPGHMLIVSKAHIGTWFDAQVLVTSTMMRALRIAKKIVDQQYSPQGYTIGLNCGEAAGQTVMHLHMHLIPRYHNDVSDPRGGVRGVIPLKQKY